RRLHRAAGRVPQAARCTRYANPHGRAARHVQHRRRVHRHDRQPSGVSETEVFDLRVTVERIEGRSVCGLAVGDYFELTESSRVRIPEGKHFCLYALSAVLPLLPAKQRKLPDGDWLEQDNFVACPDPDERVIMRIERLGQRSIPTDELT